MVVSLHDWLAGQRGFSGGAASAANNDLLLAETAGQTNPADQQTYLVFLKEPTEPGAVEAAVEFLLQQVAPGTSPRQIFSQLAGFAVDLNEDQAGRLRLRREVGSLEKNRPIRLDPPIAEPQPAPNGATGNVLPQALVRYTDGTASTRERIPWGVRAVWQGRDISTTGNSGLGTYAFVIDSGVSETTGDLIVDRTWSKSFIPTEISPFQDGLGHGTHVAGTIGALANGVGVVGVAPGATIVSLKVFDSNGGGGSYETIIEAINYAVSVITTAPLTFPLSKVVINLSLGGPVDSTLNAAMTNAANKGIRFAVAAGNNAVDADFASPATTGIHPSIYTVSAVDSTYLMASFSNWDQVTATDPNDSVDVAAPGVNVLSLSTLGNGATTLNSGTSMAAPHVAGALLMGGVINGDMVTPRISIPADPFAWAATFPGGAPGVTYSLSAPAAVDEGQAVRFTIATTGLIANTSLYWSLSGTGITTTDFTDLASLSGSSAVLADGSANLLLNVRADLLTEGNELLSVQLFADASRTHVVASRTLTLNDTSRSAVTNQTLWGTTASDPSIRGGDGNDRLTGVLANGTNARDLGQGQIDQLTGGLGADTFLLGDARGVFYDDRRAGNLGTGDYARITDFQTGIDKLQLFRGLPSSPLSYFPTVSNGLTSLYWDRNANNRLDTTGNNRDELIAIVTGSIVDTDIIWA